MENGLIVLRADAAFPDSQRELLKWGFLDSQRELLKWGFQKTALVSGYDFVFGA